MMPERDKILSVADGWVKIAGAGLCAEARTRVRAGNTAGSG